MGERVLDGPFAGRVLDTEARFWVAECPMEPGSPRQFAHYERRAEGFVLFALSEGLTLRAPTKPEQAEEQSR